MATSPSGVGAAPTPPVSTPFSWNMVRNLLQLSGMSVLQAVQWANAHWFQLMAQLMAYAGGALALALFVNALGWLPINGYLGLICVIVGLLILLSITVMAVGTLSLDAVSGDQAFAKSFRAYLRGVAHVMLFVGLVFLVLSIVQVHNFWAVGIFLLALLCFGLWSIAYEKATGIYAAVAMIIIVLAMLASGFKALTWVSPQAAALEAAMQEVNTVLSKEEAGRLTELQEIRMKYGAPDSLGRRKALQEKRATVGLSPVEQKEFDRLREGGLSAEEQLEWNKLQEKDRRKGFIDGVRARMGTLYEPVKKEVRITDLKQHVLTGLDDLPAGCYTFQTEGPMVADGNGGRWWLHADLRLNGKIPGERICFDAISPPVLSFVTGLPPSLALPQNIGITFTWAP